MNRFIHLRLALIACLLLCTCSGCTTESTDGDTTTFSYELWVPLTMIFGGAALTVAGFFLNSFSQRLSWTMMLLGLGGTLLMGPGMFLEYASVSPQEFNLRTGFWFYPTSHSVRFDNIAGIQVTSEETRGRRGRKSKEFYIVCGLKSGGQEKIPVGGLMKQGAAEQMLVTADSKQIPINVIDAW